MFECEKHTVITFFFFFSVFVVAVVNTPVAMKPFLLRKEQVSGVHFLIDTYLQSVSIKFFFFTLSTKKKTSLPVSASF